MKLKSGLWSWLSQYAFLAVLCLSLLPLVQICAAAPAQTHYLPPGLPDAITLLPPPPQLGTPEQAADMDEVRMVSHAATSADVATAMSEKEFTIFNFAPEIGPFFQPGKFPKTEAFLRYVQTDAETVTDNAKLFWKRPRPFMVDPSLATGNLEKTWSYPSGHSTESMVLALVLADLFPQDRNALLAEARSIGWHRVEIARHYPTDIYAGRTLAQAIVGQLRRSFRYKYDFAEAQKEIAAAMKANAPAGVPAGAPVMAH